MHVVYSTFPSNIDIVICRVNTININLRKPDLLNIIKTKLHFKYPGLIKSCTQIRHSSVPVYSVIKALM